MDDMMHARPIRLHNVSRTQLIYIGQYLYTIFTAPNQMSKGTRQSIVGEVRLSTWRPKEELDTLCSSHANHQNRFS
jgi:hypothetical protein